MLADDESEIKEYVSNQIIIMENQRLMMEHMGVKGCVVNNDLSTNTEKRLLKSSQAGKSSVQPAGVFIQKGLIIISRGNSTMRAYLKKLSKTKLQAYLLATVMNIALLVGYVMDVQDIQSKVESWMPMVNMTVQTVLTLIYVWVEGSIDKEQIKAQAEVNNDTYASREDSEGI